MAMVPVVATLVLALLACAEEVTAEGQSICDTVTCGKGTCREVPGLVIPPYNTSYNCICDPGSTQLLGIPFLPCTSPECHFDASCFNLSLRLPSGIPILDPCVAINCGPGECKKGDGFSYSCECHPGYVNFLNLTGFPCVKKCVFGVDCSTAPPPPPPPPSPSTAPPQGSVPSRRLLQLLLPLSLAMALLV